MKIQILILLLLLLVVNLLLIKVIWLGVLISGFVITAFWVGYLWLERFDRSRWRFLRLPSVLVFVFILAITLRVLFFGVFHITSDSMKNTLIPGDVFG